MNLRALAAPVVLASAACASTYELPMTRAELSREREPAALAAFLAQPGAGPGACAPGRVGPEVLRARSLPGELVGALRAGRVAPDVFAGCALALLPALAPERAEALVEVCLEAEVALVRDPAMEAQPALAARAAALHRVLLERSPAIPAPRGASEAAARALAGELRAAATGPARRRAAEDLAALLEVERGAWRGRPADAAVVAAAAASAEGDGAAPSLVVLARRHPDPALRADAERRLVGARIAASPSPEVRAAAAEVEARVLRDGVNAVPLAAHRPARAELTLPAGTRVVVRQDVAAQRAKLLGLAAGAAVPSVLPELTLRAELAGLSQPVGLCAASRALDPAPCVAASDVSVEFPLAASAAGGLELRELLSADDVSTLARGGEGLALPFALGGVPFVGAGGPVAYERPADLVFEGERSGARGPDLAVWVERPSPAVLLYTVRVGDRILAAAVPAQEAPGFRIVTRGARGAAGASGADGSDGSRGQDGWGATCPGRDGEDGRAGGDGGSGGDGGNGQPGGDGGDVEVTLLPAPASLRAETLALARATLVSEGGPGGSGGSGGRGGRGGSGGSGGSGTSCTDPEGRSSWLRSGTSGPGGRDGQDGRSGWSGADGRAGVVRITEESAGRP